MFGGKPCVGNSTQELKCEKGECPGTYPKQFQFSTKDSILVASIIENVIYFKLECRWRHSGECKWDGPRQKDKDKNCDQVIGWDTSGFCECSNLSKTMKRKCRTKFFNNFQTCFAACGGMFFH